MKGTNELVLNTATIIEAVQFWLNSQMTVAPKVTDVQAASDSYSKTFRVVLDSDVKEPT